MTSKFNGTSKNKTNVKRPRHPLVSFIILLCDSNNLKENLRCAYCPTILAWRYKFSLIPEIRFDCSKNRNVLEFVGKWHRIIEGPCPNCKPPK